MSDAKDDIASATKELVAGMGNEKTAPGITKVIYYIGGVFLVIGVCYIFVPYFIQSRKNDTEENKYVIDTFNSQLRNTTDTIIKFDNSIANVNSNLSILKAQIDDAKSEQNNIKNELKEHEKRINKLEVLEGSHE